MSYTDSQLIDKYCELRDRKKAIVDQTEPLTKSMNAIEAELLKRLNERGAQSTKSESGAQAYKKVNTFAKVVDREAFMEFVHENWDEAKEFLTAAISKDKVKEYMEANGDTMPPGVDVTSIVAVNFRRS